MEGIINPKLQSSKLKVQSNPSVVPLLRVPYERLSLLIWFYKFLFVYLDIENKLYFENSDNLIILKFLIEGKYSST